MRNNHSRRPSPHFERKNEGVFHAVIVFLINTSCTLLQTKDENPFDTHYCIMLAFFVTLHAYVVALIAKMNLPPDTSACFRVVLNGTCHFSGALASILLLLIIVPPLGCLTFALWLVCFARAVCYWYRELYTWVYHANFRMFEILNLLLSPPMEEPIALLLPV
ncbi:hypothetical protein CCACVL1_14329 [Corchorus capsularis]|uniref:Uncharacterized protein n=1 Tax=Corchorus capsularis TaxID=210143 RepID=A0A1R3I7I7_COCAP|nr:hypothetical protein CCACVL1_14329 [Corchorus capsularis]